jgi:hypothetical protein
MTPKSEPTKNDDSNGLSVIDAELRDVARESSKVMRAASIGTSAILREVSIDAAQALRGVVLQLAELGRRAREEKAGGVR